jgi:hypothetical protein
VLSHRPQEHLHNLLQTHLTPFDQAGEHPDILEDRPGTGQTRLRWRGLRWRGQSHTARRLGRGFAPLGVLITLLALVLPVILRTAPRRLLPPVGMATAKRATQVPPPRIARVCEKENPAVPAPAQALPQRRAASQNRPEQHVVRQNQRHHRPRAVPTFGKAKVLRNLGC